MRIPPTFWSLSQMEAFPVHCLSLQVVDVKPVGEEEGPKALTSALEEK